MTNKVRTSLLLCLVLSTAIPAMAADLFSYTVLKLPFDARTSYSW